MSSIVPRASLAERAAAVLREGVVTGLWRDHLPGERALCQELGISRPTLREALALAEREGFIAAAGSGTRRRVVPRAGRQPPPPQVVALLAGVPLRELQPFALAWIERLHDVLERADLRLDVRADRRWQGPHPERELARAAHEKPARAWIALQSSLPTQRWFARQLLPCLIAGTAHPELPLPSIDLDNRAVCRHAAGLLLAAGHRALALVLPGPLAAGDEASRQGFEEAFAAHRGSPATPVVVTHDQTPEGLRRVVARTMRLAQPPTGFIVSRSLNVLAVTTELARLGHAVGRDVALIGRDSDRFLDFLSPAVSRYSLDPSHFARRMCRMVMTMIGGDRPFVREVRLMPRFLPGESLCPGPAAR